MSRWSNLTQAEKDYQNRIRRNNQKLIVWQKKAPQFVANIINKLTTSGLARVNKQGFVQFSASKKLSGFQQKLQNQYLKAFEKIGTYTDFFKKKSKIFEEKYGREGTQEEIEYSMNIQGDYNTVLTDLFNKAKSAQLQFGTDVVKEATEYLDLQYDSEDFEMKIYGLNYILSKFGYNNLFPVDYSIYEKLRQNIDEELFTEKTFAERILENEWGEDNPFK